jgi:5-(carboxyamino)imidazole ribonucleotide synthase
MIGVFGSGQLGRMMALAARAMGYRIAVYSPDAHSPTGPLADLEVVADYADNDRVAAFVRQVAVVTFEFENVPSSIAAIAEAAGVPVRPGGWVLHTAQQRAREKHFLADAGLPVPRFAHITSFAGLHTALTRIGTPAVLKTAAFGYDGKGQVRLDTPADVELAWNAVGQREAILEEYVAFDKELSVVVGRGGDGAIVHYGAVENIHRNHILDLSIAPGRVAPGVAAEAVELARAVVEKLDVVGVLCVEFFLTNDGRLLINEMAPRPHNSGHWTIDAAVTSQFEQQVRAVCNLPLGAPDQLRPAVMANLLGDLWADGEPDWAAALAFPGVKLHLYGKQQPRPGRKMGHLTALAASDDEDVAVLMARVQAARSALLRRPDAVRRVT